MAPRFSTFDEDVDNQGRFHFVFNPNLALLLILVMLLSVQFTTVAVVSSELVTSQNEWRSDTAFVDEILFKVIQGLEYQLKGLQEGDVDVIGEFVHPAFLSETLLNDASIEINKTSQRGFAHISFNSAKWPTNLRGFRRALAFAVDKWAISERAPSYEARPIDSPVTPALGMWSIEHPAAIQSPLETYNYYDPDPVRGNLSLLQEGFYDIDRDGWREWFNASKADMAWNEVVDVQAFNPDVLNPSVIIANENGPSPDAFTVYNVTTFNELTNWEEVSITIMTGASTIINHAVLLSREAYHSVGIDVNLYYVPYSEFWSRIYNGTFDAAFLGYTTGPTPLFLADFRTSASTNSITWGWSNATFDEKVEVMLNSPFFEEVLNAVYDAQVILWHEQPMVPLYTNLLISVYRKDTLTGWIQPSGDVAAGFWSFLKVHHVDEQGDPKVGGYLKVAVDEFKNRTNPLTLLSKNNNRILELIYGSLWVQDPYTLQFVPWIADEWDIQIVYNDTLASFTGELNSVNLTEVPLVQKITFKLNPNFKWHDGQPVLPEDVAFTYWLLGEIQDSLNQTPLLPYLASNGSVIDYDRITCDNDSNTVTFIVKSLSFFSFLETGKPIVPKHIWEPILQDLGLSGILNHANELPIGSGPFKWKSRIPGDVIVLERNLEWPFRPDKRDELKISKDLRWNDSDSLSQSSLNEININLTDLLSFRIGHDSFAIILVLMSLSSLALQSRRNRRKNCF